MYGVLGICQGVVQARVLVEDVLNSLDLVTSQEQDDLMAVRECVL